MTAQEDVHLALSPPFFEKRLFCNSIHFIQQIFIEHLLCDRLCFGAEIIAIAKTKSLPCGAYTVVGYMVLVFRLKK